MGVYEKIMQISVRILIKFALEEQRTHLLLNEHRDFMSILPMAFKHGKRVQGLLILQIWNQDELALFASISTAKPRCKCKLFYDIKHLLSRFMK